MMWMTGKFLIGACILITILQIIWPQKLVTVLLRKILILMLPYWDWTRVYYSDCILTNPFHASKYVTEDDCALCESLESVKHTRDALSKISLENFLSKEHPFIVLDAMTNWDVMNTDQFWFDNVTEIYLSENYKNISPCDLESSVKTPANDLQYFLHKIHDENVQHWFGHWENCDKKAAKVLRLFYHRPYFIPNVVELSQSNWVLLSSSYRDNKFKLLDFRTELLCLVQIRGWNHIRVVPKEPCDVLCPNLVDVLVEGQILVLKNWLWKLEYLPGEKTDNFAIAIGGDWN